MLGRRDEAVEVYRAVSAPTEFDIDLAAQRDAKELLRHPMSEIRKTLVRGHNAVSGDRTDEAIRLLEPVFYGPNVSDAERTEAAYWLGRAYHSNGNLNDAATKYVWVRAHPIDDDERWAPWATYYLAKIQLARGQKEEAKEFFEEAVDFGGDYDYKKSLRRNARLALDRL
jgi:tetratricopeptide (TPR) repeat protein